MAVYLTDVRTALGDLLGITVDATWPTNYDRFIQHGLVRIGRMYDFDFGMKSLNVTTDANGQYTFQTADGVRFDPRLDVRVVNAGADNDFVFLPANFEAFDNFTKSDYRYYLSTDDSGNQTLVTTEPSTTIQVTASRVAPTISATTPTNFPSALAIARAALILVREAEDKDADTSVEEAKFQQIMQEITAQEQRNKGPQKAVTVQELYGHRTGEIQDDLYGYARQ